MVSQPAAGPPLCRALQRSPVLWSIRAACQAWQQIVVRWSEVFLTIHSTVVSSPAFSKPTRSTYTPLSLVARFMGREALALCCFEVNSPGRPGPAAGSLLVLPAAGSGICLAVASELREALTTAYVRTQPSKKPAIPAAIQEKSSRRGTLAPAAGAGALATSGRGPSSASKSVCSPACDGSPCHPTRSTACLRRNSSASSPYRGAPESGHAAAPLQPLRS